MSDTSRFAGKRERSTQQQPAAAERGQENAFDTQLTRRANIQPTDMLSSLPFDLKWHISEWLSPSAPRSVGLREYLDSELFWSDDVYTSDMSLATANRSLRDSTAEFPAHFNNTVAAAKLYVESLHWAVTAFSLIATRDDPQHGMGDGKFLTMDENLENPNWDMLFDMLPPPKFPGLEMWGDPKDYVKSKKRCVVRKAAWPLFLSHINIEMEREPEIELGAQDKRLRVLREYARAHLRDVCDPEDEEVIFSSPLSALIAMCVIPAMRRTVGKTGVNLTRAFVAIKLLYPALAGPLMLWCVTMFKLNTVPRHEYLVHMFRYAILASKERVVHPLGIGMSWPGFGDFFPVLAGKIATYFPSVTAVLIPLCAAHSVPLHAVSCDQVQGHPAPDPDHPGKCSLDEQFHELANQHVVFPLAPRPWSQ